MSATTVNVVPALEMVVFDLVNADNVEDFNVELAAYQHEFQARFGAFPAAINPGNTKFMFPLASAAAAGHVIGWMSSRVQGLRAVVISCAVGAAKIY